MRVVKPNKNVITSKKKRDKCKYNKTSTNLLSHVDFAEVLEEGEEGEVQALPRVLPIPRGVQPRVYQPQQAKDPGSEVAIHRLLSIGACRGGGTAGRGNRVLQRDC